MTKSGKAQLGREAVGEELRGLLDPRVFGRLQVLRESARRRRIRPLMAEAEDYLAHVRRSGENNTLVDVKTATAVFEALRTLSHLNLTGDPANWFKAAILYFVQTDDEEDDLSSPIGFDDDLLVVVSLRTLVTTGARRRGAE